MRFFQAGCLAIAAASPLAETVFTDFTNTDIDGVDQDFQKYEGRVAIVVNVASEWGYASSHYPQLQTFYEKYETQGLSVLAFPCNQFGGQEPGTDAEIKKHVQETYGVTFDLMHKIDVNGPKQIPLYKWMKESTDKKSIHWNFTNFVIDRCGKVHSRHEPPDLPNNWEDEIVTLLKDNPKCD